jgi:hypothetical protein
VLSSRHPSLKAETRYVQEELPAMPVARSPQQVLLTLPLGTRFYGPVLIRDEYVEFVWDGEKYKCHVDEFVDKTRTNLAERTESNAAVCTEQRRLLDAFGEAVQELLLLHEQQFLAIVAGDLDSTRFDLLIHMANEKKEQAKYTYLEHVETHGCSATSVTDIG